MKVCIINVQRIVQESVPSKLAREHLDEVRKVLRGGLDQVVSMNQANVASPQAQNSIAQSRDLLQKQLDAEIKAADNVVLRLLNQAIDAWLKYNTDVDVLVDRRQLIFCKPEFDVTDAILLEINGLTPVFPALPKVTISTKKN